MNFKEFIIKAAKEEFEQLAGVAVKHVEELLGSGTGAAKKEMAIDILLSHLPLYLKPLIPFFKKSLIRLADGLIEKTVKRMQEFQNMTGVCGA